MCLLAVAGDGSAVVAKVDVGLVAGDVLAGDAGALEAADEFLGLAGEHGAGYDFDSADFDSAWGGHSAMVAKFAVDFSLRLDGFDNDGSAVGEDFGDAFHDFVGVVAEADDSVGA